MELGKLGILGLFDGCTSAETGRLAQDIERLGYGALWFPHQMGREPFSFASYLLGRTDRLVVGTGVAIAFAYEPISHLNLWRIPDGKPPGFDGWAETHANYVVFSGDSDLTVGGSASGAFSLLYEADDSSTRVFVKGKFEIDKIKKDNWVTENLEANKLEEAGVTLCIDS